MQTPPGIRIPSLRARRADVVNLMEPGSGTPWEDRGTLGLGKAFTETCKLALRNPVLLMNSIRRPETASDGWSFALWCGIMWGLSCIAHGSLYFLYLCLRGAGRNDLMLSAPEVINTQALFAKWGLAALLMPAFVLLLLKLGAGMFHRLVSAEEMKGNAPPVLTFNIFAYCLAPSIVAPIPLVGPALALGWMLSMMIRVAMGRLHIKRTGAIICSVLTFVSMLGIALVVISVAYLINRVSLPESVEQNPVVHYVNRRAQ